MKFYAVAVTLASAPETPQLHDAWPVALIEDNGLHGPIMLNRGLSEALAEPDTLAAGIVQVEIPDAQVLPLLRGLDIPTVAGAASAADPTTPPPGR